MDADTRTQHDAKTLECMEVWGGNEPASDALSLPGIDAWVWSRSHAGDSHGGDIYYISACGQGRVSRFAIADAVGHGEAASGLARRMRALMRKHIHTPDQRDMARALNRDLVEMSSAGTFATALLTSYFPPKDELVVCNAGHPPPLWFRKDRGDWVWLHEEAVPHRQAEANLPLGLIPPTEYVQFAVPLGVGDLVLLYTDGLVESRLPSGQLLEHEGLRALLSELDPTRPERLAPQVIAALDERRVDGKPQDDETIVLLHHNGADPPTASSFQQMRAMADMMLQALPRLRA